MALTNAEKQRRYRQRQKAKDPRVIERTLLVEAERKLSDRKRIALGETNDESGRAEAITIRNADWIHLQIMMACQAF
jgi:hypothetical protein